MVAHGAGGAILPRVIAERYRQRYSFAVIGLQDRWAQRRLCLCYQDDASLSPALATGWRHPGSTGTNGAAPSGPVTR